MTREQAEGERRNPLHTAQREDGIRAAEVCGVENRRMHAALATRGRAGDHVPNAGGLCGGDAHDGRGNMSVASAGDVAARGLYRDQALPCDEPRRELGFELRETRALRLGEAPHPLPGESDVLAHLRGELAFGARDRLGGHDDVAAPIVERLRETACRRLTALLDFRKHSLHDRAGLRLPARGGAACPLEPG